MKKTPTYHKGASDERTVWLRKVNTLRKADPTNRGLTALADFGKGRVARFKKKKGGL